VEAAVVVEVVVGVAVEAAVVVEVVVGVAVEAAVVTRLRLIRRHLALHCIQTTI
jgi:hypothetical protein